MENAYEDIKQHREILEVIELMFDFELDISEIEQKMVSIPTTLGIIFNYADLFFQLYSGTEDETYCKVVEAMDKLRKYYDKKASINYSHSEMLIDIFRFCIRNDISVSKLIGKSVSETVPTPQDMRQQIMMCHPLGTNLSSNTTE